MDWGLGTEMLGLTSGTFEREGFRLQTFATGEDLLDVLHTCAMDMPNYLKNIAKKTFIPCFPQMYSVATSAAYVHSMKLAPNLMRE